MSVEIVGSAELVAKLESLSDRLGELSDEALAELADRIVEDAKSLCPVDTGSLRRSIRWERDPSGGVIIAAGGGGVINPRTKREVDYAAYVEFGTSRAPAQPFLQPAIEQNISALEEILAKKIEGAVRG
ncbi:MAG: HK97 gp10 family phage protein [Candidatus Bathyarchaeia archaeon]